MVSVAELEAGMIISSHQSGRWPLRRPAAKKLGGYRPAPSYSRTERYGPQRACGARANRHTADASRPNVASTVKSYRRPARRVAGRHCASVRRHAAQLNERGIPTSSGQETWQAVQVSRGLGRGFDLGLFSRRENHPLRTQGRPNGARARNSKPPDPVRMGPGVTRATRGRGCSRAPDNARK